MELVKKQNQEIKALKEELLKRPPLPEKKEEEASDDEEFYRQSVELPKKIPESQTPVIQKQSLKAAAPLVIDDIKQKSKRGPQVKQEPSASRESDAL